ncbi:MAG: ATP-binding protein [Promethearchaeota archaeon]
MGDDILFWAVRIVITQSPEEFQPRSIQEGEIPEWQTHENFRSFLYDPIGSKPPISFGLELLANEKLMLTFFTTASSELDGYEIGQAWLSSLKYQFVGLDGRIEVIPVKVHEAENYKNWDIFEIKFPSGLIKRKVNILERLSNTFYQISEIPLKLFILWQKESRLNEIHKYSDRFLLRIFISCDLKSLNVKERHKIMGIIKFLSLDVETDKGVVSEIEKCTKISYMDILKGSIFHNALSHIKSVVKEDLNFDFPDSLPLPGLPILENENVRYIDLSVKFIKNAISIGYHIKNGVITNHKTYVPIAKLSQDIAIFGKSGSGKTFFLARFIEELSRKAEKVGILILNVAKSSQEIFYKDFKILKYSDDNFRVPYFFRGEVHSLEKYLQETATYICASLGLKNVFEKIIYRTSVGFIKLKGKPPDLFINFLNGVENYIRKNPYGPEEQANLLQIFRNRKNVFDEQKIQNVLRLSDNLPEWINKWINGKNIYLDLSMSSKFIKLLVVNAIFQVVRAITKDNIIEQLKYVIVIDEAHAILEKPITNNSDDADFIMKEQMAKIFSELLKEYRSRGVGFIIADQSPDGLFSDVVSQPSIKVIFREDYPNNLLFSEDSIERQILTQFPNRLSLVINGSTGEKYIIKTLDYNL